MQSVAEESRRFHYVDILARNRQRINSGCQDVPELFLDLSLDPGDTQSQWFRFLDQCLEGLSESFNRLREYHSVITKVQTSDTHIAKRRPTTRFFLPHDP